MSTFFDLSGLHMHTVVAGREDGPLVILLHGAPETAYSFRHQIGPLAQAGYRVVAPDQRGYDLTDKTPPYNIDTLVKDVVQLIDACRRQQAFVVGHDVGAGVAWRLVETHPERVARLAILNVPRLQVLAHALAHGKLRQLAKSWYIGFYQLPVLPEWLLSRHDYFAMRFVMRHGSRPGTFTRTDLEQYLWAWRQPGALAAMLGWYRAEFRRALGYLGREPMPRISVPTLMIWGEQDVALEVDLATQSAATLDNGRLIRFPDATHWVHEDYPQAVTQLLLDHFGPLPESVA